VAVPVRSGALRIVVEDWEPPERPIHLIYPQSRLLPARTCALIDWLNVELPLLQGKLLA